VRLSRGGQSAADSVNWDPEQGTIDTKALEGFDGVVHLAGDNIASGRWTDAKKNRIRESRIKGTRLLCEALASLSSPPKVLVSASAIGFYGDRGDQTITEESAPGKGFLAEVCRQWEEASKAVEAKGIRLVNLRIGIVLSTEGGALKQMLPPFQMGVGGRLGSGKQYMSWVALDDLCGIIAYSLSHDDLQGPINAVAPNPVTNNDFTSALGAALHRPTIFPVPGPAIQLLLGEMADELLLSGAKVQPTKVLASGYKYSHPQVGPFLSQLFKTA
jgi:uncharacterized protein (TIGR01777 family)